MSSMTALKHIIHLAVQGNWRGHFVSAHLCVKMRTGGYMFPQFHVTFSNLDHPYVFLQSVSGDGWSQDYLSLSQLDEGWVHILQEDTLAVVPEIATNLQISVDRSGNIQAHVQQRGRGHFDVLLSVTDQKLSPFVPAVCIRLSPIVDDKVLEVRECNNVGGNQDVWQASNEFLSGCAGDSKQIYERVDFSIVYADGGSSYKGTYLLTTMDQDHADLGRHVRRFCETHSGRRNVFLSHYPQEPAYSPSLAKYEVERYDKMLKMIGEERRNGHDLMIQHYEIP